MSDYNQFNHYPVNRTPKSGTGPSGFYGTRRVAKDVGIKYSYGELCDRAKQIAKGAPADGFSVWCLETLKIPAKDFARICEDAGLTI